MNRSHKAFLVASQDREIELVGSIARIGITRPLQVAQSPTEAIAPVIDG